MVVNAKPHAVSVAPWPAPSALKGLKSRTKPIFKAAAGEVAIHDRTMQFQPLVVLSASRILAVGEGGRALARLLGQRGLTTGEMFHAAGLTIVHLGPHLAKAASSGSSQADHANAVSAALRAKPHIVVLDEALFAGDEAWIQLFDQLMRGEALQSFKGAVVACVEKEPSSLQSCSCLERWSETSDGILRQEEITKSRLEIVEDAVTACAQDDMATDVGSRRAAREASQAASDITALMEEARELSEFCFEEDIVEAAQVDGDSVTLLCERTSAGTRSLRGYLCHRYYPAPRAELHISRLAVPLRHRGHGHARILMQWALERAARIPQDDLAWITLGALESAVAFYARLGFTPAQAREAPKEGSDPQTWMELPNASAVSQGSAASSLPLELSMPQVVAEARVSDEAEGEVQGTVQVPASQSQQGQGKSQSHMPSTKNIKKRIQEIEKRLKAQKKKGAKDEEEMDLLQAELEELKAELASK